MTPPKLTITTTTTTDRRPLSFPAVHPCESISSTTLLSSLITLSQTISTFPSHSSATQKRNIRETTRQLNILLIFFQEIQHEGSPIPNPIIPCFSNLHFTFQKFHFLLQDCSREGSCLWMLMKSQHVAKQFRLLTRAVATALESLPLNSINVCHEVKEFVELVTKQARKVKLQLDPNDEREMKRVSSVLNQFERGTEPDVEAMKHVLNYLGIKGWNDCNKEIKFIEEETDYCYSNQQEVQFLSSLRGFLCYSRVVIFEEEEEPLNFQSLSTTTTGSAEEQSEEESLISVTPEEFRCPISLELMTDPVTVSTGQTYNRSSIQRWLKSGNMTCPKTGESLKNTELFPNVTIKKLIYNFCSDNGISIAKSRFITKTVEPGCHALAQAMQFLSWFLARRLVFGTDKQKNKAAYEIRLLARSNIFNRECLVEMGTVPPLLDLLSDPTTQENAISALLKLSKHSSGQQVIMEYRGLPSIIKVLIKGISLEARQVAAAIIFYLSSVKKYRKLIGENKEAVSGLVDIIKEGTISGKKNAVVAIFGLLLLPKNHSKVLSAGAVPGIVNILASSNKADLVTDCLAVLVALAESKEGAYDILQASALELVVKGLKSETSRAGKEYCVSILLSLCVNFGTEVIGVLVKDPSLMPLLYSLVTDGTPHAAKKARSLINVLQEFNENRSSGLVGSSVSQQRLVHLS